MTSQKMDQYVKGLWTKALNDDSYKQGRGQLLKDGEFCCLGVLCDIYIKQTNLAEWLPTTPVTGKHMIVEKDALAGNYMTTGLPLYVRQWAGGLSYDPHILYRGEPSPLSQLNDVFGLDFKQIAQLIGEQL